MGACACVWTCPQHHKGIKNVHLLNVTASYVDTVAINTKLLKELYMHMPTL